MSRVGPIDCRMKRRTILFWALALVCGGRAAAERSFPFAEATIDDLQARMAAGTCPVSMIVSFIAAYSLVPTPVRPNAQPNSPCGRTSPLDPQMPMSRYMGRTAIS